MPSGRLALARSTLRLLRPLCFAWMLTGLVSFSSADDVDTGKPNAPAATRPIDFARDIRPVLAERCYACHGAERQESDLRLDRRDDALRGGAEGVAIVPGHSGKSPLVVRISGTDADLRMPPKGDLLPAETVALFRAWIDQGAGWPADDPVAQSGEKHWSLRPLVRPAVPVVPGLASDANPIDAFIRRAPGGQWARAVARRRPANALAARDFRSDRPAADAGRAGRLFG